MRTLWKSFLEWLEITHLYPRARETAPPEPRSGFRPRRRFLFYEFRLGANDGDVGGAGTRYGVDVTTPRSPHPPARYPRVNKLCALHARARRSRARRRPFFFLRIRLVAAVARAQRATGSTSPPAACTGKVMDEQTCFLCRHGCRHCRFASLHPRHGRKPRSDEGAQRRPGSNLSISLGSRARETAARAALRIPAAPPLSFLRIRVGGERW